MHPIKTAIAEEEYVFGLHPFRLFCLYHLGLDDDGKASFKNANQCARILEVTQEQMNDALTAYRMTASTLLHSNFDLASAQADISVAMPDVDLLAIARIHFNGFLSAKENARDWDAELEP